MIQASKDIGIGIMDLCLNKPMATYYDGYENTCAINYCLSGHVSYSETGVPSAALRGGEVGVFAIPRTRGMMMIPSNEHVFLVSVASTKQFHKTLPYAEECEQFDDPLVQDLLCRLATPAKINAKLYNHFDRIMNNDMAGSFHSTYIDAMGKVILSDIWQERIFIPLSGKEQVAISNFEHQALLSAKDLLTKQYLSPPTIQELSRMVALNEYSLKKGFKLLFGKTIFDFVRCLRMDNARHLLEDSSMSIGQVASMVGYTNASHFARAFRSEYGINPKDFRFGC